MATHPEHEAAPPSVRSYVEQGSSPRGAQAMVLAGKVRALLDGRVHVAGEDVRQAARPALRHRIMLNYEGQAEGIEPDALVAEIVDSLSVPGRN
jgi:MoxR-like ATPase